MALIVIAIAQATSRHARWPHALCGLRRQSQTSSVSAQGRYGFGIMPRQYQRQHAEQMRFFIISAFAASGHEECRHLLLHALSASVNLPAWTKYAAAIGQT